MSDNDLLVLKGSDVATLLVDREFEIIDTVRRAYETHRKGDSRLPHSTFLRFPNDESNRIIALPGYLGGDSRLAGLKWVSSFPANIEAGLERASAVIVLNSSANGRPEVILEGSIISAKRTAASAALAAQALSDGIKITGIGLVGCGPINFEIVRFCLAAMPAIKRLTVFDLNPDRVKRFAKKCDADFSGIQITSAADVATVLRDSPVISFATTATTPYLSDCSMCAPGTVLLHISLRDLAAERILECDNVVDDVDHVCRAQTSIHLAEQLVGNREFIRSTLAEILIGVGARKRDAAAITVFSPFGLGILDLAVSSLVRSLARDRGLGTLCEAFLPDSGGEYRREDSLQQSCPEDLPSKTRNRLPPTARSEIK